MLFYFVTAVIIFVFIYVLSKNIGEWAQNNRAPVTRIQATVIDMQEKDDTSMMPVGTDGGMMPMSNTTYHVRFQTADGEQDFSVPKKLYRSLRVGQAGLLESKGTRFLSFETE